MTVVVVDASLAVLLLVPEVDSTRAWTLMEQWAAVGIRRLAPTLIWAEVTNALRKRVVRHDMTLEEALQAWEGIWRFNIMAEDFNTLCPLALTMAHGLGLSAVYDAVYLALAQNLGCEFWTADERLYNAVRDRLPWVRWVGQYRSIDA